MLAASLGSLFETHVEKFDILNSWLRFGFLGHSIVGQLGSPQHKALHHRKDVLAVIDARVETAFKLESQMFLYVFNALWGK